jgi:hypothetical protein
LVFFAFVTLIGVAWYSLFYEPSVRRYIVAAGRFLVSMVILLGGAPFGFTFVGTGPIDAPEASWRLEISMRDASLSSFGVFAVGAVCITALAYLYAVHTRLLKP